MQAMILFPRKPGPSKSHHVRERAAAHKYLDRLIAGRRVSQRLVTWALKMTGDIE
jgi:hypothetical protein